MILLTFVALLSTGAAQGPRFAMGEAVELRASGDRWQKCTVIDPGSEERVMRMRCEAYDDGVYARGGGIYVESPTSSSVRKPAVAATPAMPPAASTDPVGQVEATAPPPAPVPPSATGYAVGQPVEIEASKHWVPCIVSEIDGASADAMIRVRCDAYPALARAAGSFIVHDRQSGIRPATGAIGPVATVATPTDQAPTPTGGGTLRPGEYACYGTGMRILAGLAFKVTGPGRYNDLEGGNAGRFAVSGTNVTFDGGHLDGQTGRDFNGKGFRIGAQASCERWG